MKHPHGKYNKAPENILVWDTSFFLWEFKVSCFIYVMFGKAEQKGKPLGNTVPPQSTGAAAGRY
jgi:hypothetical protein